jgi:hypothetical protein
MSKKGALVSMVLVVIASLIAALAITATARADVFPPISAYPYVQGWDDGGAISTSDDWSGVPGVIG